VPFSEFIQRTRQNEVSKVSIDGECMQALRGKAFVCGLKVCALACLTRIFSRLPTCVGSW